MTKRAEYSPLKSPFDEAKKRIIAAGSEKALFPAAAPKCVCNENQRPGVYCGPCSELRHPPQKKKIRSPSGAIIHKTAKQETARKSLGQRQACGACGHSRNHHSGASETVFLPKRRLVGAGPCGYAQGGFKCSCDGFLKSNLDATIAYNLRSEDVQFVRNSKGDVRSETVKLSEILVLIATEWAIVRPLRRREGQAIRAARAGAPTTFVDGKLETIEERLTQEHRAIIYKGFAKKNELQARKVFDGIVAYRDLQFMYGEASPAINGTNRAEFDVIRGKLIRESEILKGRTL